MSKSKVPVAFRVKFRDVLAALSKARIDSGGQVCRWVVEIRQSNLIRVWRRLERAVGRTVGFFMPTEWPKYKGLVGYRQLPGFARKSAA